MTPYPPRPQGTVAWDDFCDSDGVRWVEQVGISSTPVDIDTEIVADDLLDTNGQLKDSFGTLLRTGHDTDGHDHSAMGADEFMVSAPTPTEVAEVASDTYLLPLYLQAICELDQ